MKRRKIYNLALDDTSNPYSTEGKRNLWEMGYRLEKYNPDRFAYGSYNWRCWYRGLMFRLIKNRGLK